MAQQQQQQQQKQLIKCRNDVKLTVSTFQAGTLLIASAAAAHHQFQDLFSGSLNLWTDIFCCKLALQALIDKRSSSEHIAE
ncbi:hypothetical protein ACLKA6_014632 [Drosophila palustris]